jgi:3-oxoacyl-[acyl-carrier protein] reductase
VNGFEGQIAVVTGAASGIGLAIARAFHEAGASVVLSDVRQDALNEVRDTRVDPERLAFIQTDVRDTNAVANLIAETESTFGPPSIMIANAGIVPNISVLSMTTEEWDTTLEVNLRGVFLSCQAAARNMVEHGTPGKIVTITSIARDTGRLGAAAYCASKAGVEMFTKVLAMELAEHRINVNAIAPGVIDTQRDAPRSVSAFGEALDQAIPWGRRGTTDEVAQAALFLCSPGAEYITGAILPVDGGASTGWTQMPYSSPQH